MMSFASRFYLSVFGTLPRYIARRYLFTFSTNLLAVSFLVFLVDFGENARRFSEIPGYSAELTALLSIMRVPAITQIAIPFVVLIASITTLIALNRKYELVIARASGLSAWQFLLPIILCNLMVGIITVTMINPLGAAAARFGDEIAADAKFFTSTSNKKNPPWLRQNTDEGTSIIGGRKMRKKGTVIQGVTVLRFDDQNAIKDRVEADKATLTEGFWTLTEVTVFENGKSPVKMEQLQIKTNLEAEFVQETFASADTVSFFELGDKIRAANSFGLKANVYAMKLHQLMALPVLLVSMTFIAAMVSLTFVRFGQSLYAILGGILCGFLLYVMSELITAFGEAGSVPPIVAAWVPVIVASTLGSTVLLHKEDG